MADWHEELQGALGRGDPAEMKAALSRLPRDVLHMAVPYFSRLAEDAVRDNELEHALTYLNQLVEIEPDECRWREQRARVHSKLDELAAVIEDAERITQLRPDDTTGYRLLAEANDGLRNRHKALAAYQKLRVLDPEDQTAKQRIEFLQEQLRNEEVLQQVLNPGAAGEARTETRTSLPVIQFDPRLLADPAIPSSLNASMVAGLKQHLWRYGVHQSSRNVLDRLDDERWLRAWDQALAGTAGGRVLLHGSELGTFAVRALTHGAAHVTAVEPSPLDARIASGIVQKHLLTAWHSHHGESVQSWSEEERLAAFTEFARNVEVLPADSSELQAAKYDWLIFPNLDHTLLGTGIMRTVRSYCERGSINVRVLPGTARVFAMAVQWSYPSMGPQLEALASLRWSPYPQPLELSERCWTALTAPTEIGTIDFNDFAETRWTRELAVVTGGRVDAIVFWFELHLGDARLNSGVGELRCLKPAVQYTDALDVRSGSELSLQVHVEASRLYFETTPAPRQLRSGVLPSWYVPMIVDEARNQAYSAALKARLDRRNDIGVLDIGAGCGLLSMMAARLGAQRVFGCEIDGALARVAGQIAAANEAGDKVRIINKDSRRLTIPDDLPAKADLAVFELFDCSLIGEGVLHFLAHAREHLLAPNAVYVPMAGRIRAMVIEYRVDRIWDVDVNILNPYRFSAEFINVDASQLRHRQLSDAFDVFTFDFAAAAPTPQEQQIDIPALAAGTAGALLFWFDLQLAPDQWLSNEPGPAQQFHWKQGLQFLPEVEVQAGMTLPLTAKHNGSAVTFRWRQDALAAELFSKLPRFDPRMFQQASELQAQTASLFQHCMADHAEYVRVAQLAQLLAIDPAAHGLDPRIAQRFVAKFFANNS